MLNVLAVLLTSVALIGCARDARLYPINDTSIATGVLEAHFMSYGTGHGGIEIPMPDGELLKGEYSLIRGGSFGSGSVYGSVYGMGQSVSFNSHSASYSMPGASAGTASVFGNKGTSMICEFFNDNFSGHGNGGCRTSKGGLYRLQF